MGRFELESLTEGWSLKRLLGFALAVGMLQIAAFYLAAALVGGEGSLPIMHPDTLLYCQAARRIAEGHAFSFSAGTLPSTGTTSVLHPFVLAIPYWLGARGASLVTAGFWINSAFFLIFLAGWCVAVRHWIARPLAQAVAAVLLSLSGHVAICVFSQNDMGLWLAVSGWLAAGLAQGRRLLYGPLLVLAPWIRPEGMVCVLAFGGILLLSALRGGRSRRDLALDVLVFAVGLASMAGVFALNVALTGAAQFSSVANKGHFKLYPLAEGVHRTALDLMTLLKSYVLGMGGGGPRQFFMVPLLSALLFWTGLLCRDWRRGEARGLLALLLAVFGGFLTVAMSGWQNANFDRYLTWTVPVFVLFQALGACQCRSWLAARRPAVAWLPVALPVLLAAGTSLYMVFLFHWGTEKYARLQAFADEMDQSLPRGASVAATGSCGVAYALGDRRMAHLSGIYSPEYSFFMSDTFEILKNEPKTRFNYWFIEPDDHFCENFDELTGEQVLLGSDGREVRAAIWARFDRAGAEPSGLAPTGSVLRARVDIGYLKDERRADYEVEMRYGLRPFRPFLLVADLDGKKVPDAGRVVFGGDAMTVPLVPGRDVTVVMRTTAQRNVTMDDTLGSGRMNLKYRISDPFRLRVLVDGIEADVVTLHQKKEGFGDVKFRISGKFITKETCRFSFLGDHIVFGYWFYQ